MVQEKYVYNTIPRPGTFYVKRPDRLVFPHVLRNGVSFTTGETIRYLVPAEPLVNKDILLLLDILKQSEILKDSETKTDPIYFVVYNLAIQQLQYLRLAPIIFVTPSQEDISDLKKALTASAHMFYMDFDPL